MLLSFLATEMCKLAAFQLQDKLIRKQISDYEKQIFIMNKQINGHLYSLVAFIFCFCILS